MDFKIRLNKVEHIETQKERNIVKRAAVENKSRD